MEKVLKDLEQIAKLAKSGNEKETQAAIKTARETLTGASQGNISSLKELDKELSVWQSKLSVIWKEPAGRQGIVKHATYWAEQLRNLWQTK